MTRNAVLFVCIFLLPLARVNPGAAAQGGPIHVNVILVQLSVAVTDRKGNYVSGLKPEDFEILEDGIAEKTATFEEGTELGRAAIKPPAADDGYLPLAGFECEDGFMRPNVEACRAAEAAAPPVALAPGTGRSAAGR